MQGTTYPIADDSSSVVPNASNISSSFGRLSPAMVTDVPAMMKYNILYKMKPE